MMKCSVHMIHYCMLSGKQTGVKSRHHMHRSCLMRYIENQRQLANISEFGLDI